MARQKQVAVQRTPSELLMVSNGKAHRDVDNPDVGNSTLKKRRSSISEAVDKAKDALTPGNKAGMGTLVFCIAGIYASL
jgi:hypothetical protein